jgi:hypothetical protein
LPQQRQSTAHETPLGKARSIRATGQVADHSLIRQGDIAPLRQQHAVRLDPDPLKDLPTLIGYGIAAIACAAAQLAHQLPDRPLGIQLRGNPFN